MIFEYLKSRLTNKELEEFKKKYVNSKKNQHGFFNPVKLFYDSLNVQSALDLVLSSPTTRSLVFVTINRSRAWPTSD